MKHSRSYLTAEQWYAWWGSCPAERDGLCECAHCQADDDSFYAEYRFDDHRALLRESKRGD